MISSRRTVLFAFESTEVSGLGHALRCLSYARELVAHNFKTYYFDVTRIDWLKSQFLESSLFEANSQNMEFDVLIIDSYRRDFITYVLEKFSAKKTMLIADSSTELTQVDSVVWLDICAPPQDCPVIASGLSYMPVRVKENLMSPTYNQRVLVTLGGSPSMQLMKSLFVAISNEKYKDFEFNVFAPPDKWIAGSSNISWWNLGPNIDEVAQGCGTIISGSGTSIWSFLASNKAVGAVLVAQNQRNNYEFVLSRGVAISLGDNLDTFLIDDRNLELLLFDSETRNHLTDNRIPELDLDGAIRFAKLISSFVL